MGKKERKTYNLDSGVVKSFQQIATKKGLKYSELLEQLLEQFIAKDGEMFADEIYAPRLEYTITQAVKKETNRLAAMIYKNQLETSAVLIGLPSLYKKMQKGMEDALRLHINPEILMETKETDPVEGIDFISPSFRYNYEGIEMIEKLRKQSAKEYHENKRKEKAAVKEGSF
jgi:antitoxin component of RelBE/YafQ-DinJ toxin-antitoxin module